MTHLPVAVLCRCSRVCTCWGCRPHKLLCWQLVALRHPGGLCAVGVIANLVKLGLQGTTRGCLFELVCLAQDMHFFSIARRAHHQRMQALPEGGMMYETPCHASTVCRLVTAFTPAALPHN